MVRGGSLLLACLHRNSAVFARKALFTMRSVPFPGGRQATARPFPVCRNIVSPSLVRLGSLSASKRGEAESKSRGKMTTHFTLNTGARIPSVGLGTYNAAPGVVADALATAVKVFTFSSRDTSCSELVTCVCLAVQLFCLAQEHLFVSVIGMRFG
jgi:hypothetical protein